MSLKDWDRLVDSNNEEAPLSRRRFLASTTAGVASALVTTQAVAETLADVPPREVMTRKRRRRPAGPRT